MVVAVRCPNPQCRKFMLVEEHQRGQIVTCLICKQSIKVPAVKAASAPNALRELS
jgi:hypothetical protein